MPDSLSKDELRMLKRLYPEPPYKQYIWNYSYFMGDAEQKLAQARQEVQRRHRVLTKAGTDPRLRLQPGERVSREQPYTIYTDVELQESGMPSDSWPYQSYYYLMDYDDKWIAAVPRNANMGQFPVKRPSARVRAPGYVSTRQPPRLPAQANPAPPTATFITLRG